MKFVYKCLYEKEDVFCRINLVSNYASLFLKKYALPSLFLRLFLVVFKQTQLDFTTNKC